MTERSNGGHLRKLPSVRKLGKPCDGRYIKDFQKRKHEEVLSELRTRFVELQELFGMLAETGAQSFELNVGTIVHHAARGPGQIVRIDFNNPRGKPYRVMFARGEVHEYNEQSALKLIGVTLDERASATLSGRRKSHWTVMQSSVVIAAQNLVAGQPMEPQPAPDSRAKRTASGIRERASQEDANKRRPLHRAVVCAMCMHPTP
jgi:hypothetical protein